VWGASASGADAGSASSSLATGGPDSAAWRAASAAARAADLIMIPLQPSLIDLKTLGATLEIIRLSGNKPSLALLSRVKATGTRHEETTAWLQAQAVQVCPVCLGERVTYQDAYAQGLAVTEAEPSGKAALEVQEVYKYISRLIGLPTRRMNNEEGRSARKRAA
jgi:chromosome partitioning protein